MSDPIKIQHEGDTAKGRYFTDVKGAQKQAELVWHASGNIRHTSHTFVPPEARGKGIAEKLVQAMISDARKQGFRIAPDCSYVATYFRRHPDLAELRA